MKSMGIYMINIQKKDQYTEERRREQVASNHLIKDPEKFIEYLRMGTDSFNELLKHWSSNNILFHNIWFN